jgi:K+ transporter
MILVGAICAVLWGIGWAMGAPIKQRWGMIAAVFVGVILAHLILPIAHPLRMNTGGSWQVWALLAAFVAVIWMYRKGLRKLRVKVQPETVILDASMSDTELERYARHIVMPEIGGSGQMRLRQSDVLVIGAGGQILQGRRRCRHDRHC